MIEGIVSTVDGLLEPLDLDPAAHDVLGVLLIAMVGLMLWTTLALVARALRPSTAGEPYVEERVPVRRSDGDVQPKLTTNLEEHRGLKLNDRVVIRPRLTGAVITGIVERRFLGVVFQVMPDERDEVIEVPDDRVEALDPPIHPEVAGAPPQQPLREQITAIRAAESEVTDGAKRRRTERAIRMLSER